ncbi:MAG: hypothetical protein ACO3FI_04995 [Cyclobacteriaceae bacterium]
MIVICSSQKTFSQIQDVEIQIINPLKVTLPSVERNFDKVPVKPLDPVYPPLIYGYRPLEYMGQPFRLQVRPLRLKEEPVENLREGFVTLGYGNYGAPLAGLFLPLYQNQKTGTSSALRAFHNSFARGPVEGKRSASGNTSLALDFRGAGKTVSSEGIVSFKNVYSNFYGYPENTLLKNDTLGISYSAAGLGIRLTDTRKSALNYSLSGAFSHLWNNRKASETDINVDFSASAEVAKEGSVKFKFRYDLLARSDTGIDPKPRNLLSGGASYGFKINKNFHAEAGFSAVAEDDSLVKKSLHVYPLLKWNILFAPRLNLEGYLRGSVDKVSLHSLTTENIWLDKNTTIGHTNNLIDFGTFLNAQFKGIWSAKAGFKYNDFSNMFFYVNQASDSSRFRLDYDEATRINPHLSIQFNKGSVSGGLKFDLFLWSVSHLASPFHKPKGSVEWNLDFALSQKLFLRPYAIIYWGITAPVASDPARFKTLPAANDFGFRMDFNFSERGSVTARVNNLTGNSYSLFQNYPVRGFQAIAGLTWRF